MIVSDQLKHRTTHKTSASGTFEAFTLFDLLVTLTQKPESCKLHLLIAGEEALVVIEQQRIVFASYQEQLGEEAVMSIFSALEDDSAAEFLLEPLSPDAPSEAQTIKASLEQLLLAVATMLDQRRARKPLVSAKAARTHARRAEPEPPRWRFRPFKPR